MTWLNDNWIWLGAAAAVLVVVYGATRIAEKRKQRAEAERMIVALMGMLAAFEEIVHQTLGAATTPKPAGRSPRGWRRWSSPKAFLWTGLPRTRSFLERCLSHRFSS